MKAKFFIYPFLALPLLGSLFPGCTAGHYGESQLQTITFIDRNGISETISNPERIKQYRTKNFENPQPYEKILCIHSRDKEGNIPSYLYSYHENGQPKQYLEVVNSRALGRYKEWHQNGNLKIEVEVIGGEADLNSYAEKSWIFDGAALAWDEEGNLQAEIPYQKGALQGTSLYYHANGAIWKKVPFTENAIHGTLEVYLDNGAPFQNTEYVQGKLHGSSVRCWQSGAAAFQETYESDNLLRGRYYDQEGRLVSEINQGNGRRAIFGRSELAELHEYRNGQPEGRIDVFGRDGKLIRSYHVRNGLKHGEETEYYEIAHLRHLPKLLITWHEGKIQGEAKTWYDNGVQESCREISNNAKNGISTAWYRDGTLMLIEEYQADKLVRGEYFKHREKTPISTIEDGSGVATLFDSDGNFIHKVNYKNGVPAGTM